MRDSFLSLNFSYNHNQDFKFKTHACEVPSFFNSTLILYV